MSIHAKSSSDQMPKITQVIFISAVIIVGIIIYFFILEQKTTVVTMNEALHLIKNCKVTEAYIGRDGRRDTTTTHAVLKLKDGSVVRTEKNTPLFIFQDAIDDTKCT